jgi:hypothetical protein
MSEFFFVVKTALFSALVLMVLQMKIGGSTLEQHSETWIYHSRVGGELQHVARGAVRAGHEGWDWVKVKTDGRLGSSDDHGTDHTAETNRERSSRSRSRHEDLD